MRPEDRVRLLHMRDAAREAIVAMRNRLIHAYFDIDRDVVWDTVTADLPPLLAAVETILGTAES